MLRLLRNKYPSYEITETGEEGKPYVIFAVKDNADFAERQDELADDKITDKPVVMRVKAVQEDLDFFFEKLLSVAKDADNSRFWKEMTAQTIYDEKELLNMVRAAKKGRLMVQAEINDGVVFVAPQDNRSKEDLKAEYESSLGEVKANAGASRVVIMGRRAEAVAKFIASIDKSQIRTVNGGIDMNASNLDLQIKRDGNGLVLPVSQQDLDNIQIDGLVPVLLDIKPATGMALFN